MVLQLVLPAAVCSALGGHDGPFRTLTLPPPLSLRPQVLYSDSFRKQVQGKAAFVLDTPEMRRVRESQRIVSGVRPRLPLLRPSGFGSANYSLRFPNDAAQVRYHEDFEKNKGSFTPTTSDLVTERVKRNTQDFSDISYRGIQRRVVEMERRRALEHDQETITGASPQNSHQRFFFYPFSSLRFFFPPP